MSWTMNRIPASVRGCYNRLMPCCSCRNRRRGPPPEELPPPMTEEEKEQYEYLENLLPCHIYRLQETDTVGEVEESPSYRLYDGFHQDEAQQQPLSLRLHQQECSICLMEYEDGEKLTSSHNPKCPHAFHRDCMKRWLVSNSECPCCRKGFLEFEDDSENGNATNFTDQWALWTSSFQGQVRQIRQGIENRLEPIILRLEQERQATIIDPDTADLQGRNNGNNHEDGNHNDTPNQYDVDEQSDDSPILLQHRIGRLREGLSDQLDILRVRVMEQTTTAAVRIARFRGNDGSSLPTNAFHHPLSDNDDHITRNTVDSTANRAIDGQPETPPNLLAATTTKVLEMGSARWKDVSARMVVLGLSFRGAEPAAESNPLQEPSPSDSTISNPAP